MVPVFLIFATGGVVLTLVILWLARSASLEEADARERLLRPDSGALAYDVPNGQDPAPIVVALRLAGYDSVEDTSGTAHRILVARPNGRVFDRAHVRAVIGTAEGRSAATELLADEAEQSAP